MMVVEKLFLGLISNLQYLCIRIVRDCNKSFRIRVVHLSGYVHIPIYPREGKKECNIFIWGAWKEKRLKTTVLNSHWSGIIPRYSQIDMEVTFAILNRYYFVPLLLIGFKLAPTTQAPP